MCPAGREVTHHRQGLPVRLISAWQEDLFLRDRVCGDTQHICVLLCVHCRVVISLERLKAFIPLLLLMARGRFSLVELLLPVTLQGAMVAGEGAVTSPGTQSALPMR